MSEEKLFANLEEIFEFDDDYSIFNYLKNNVGALLTAISLFAALMIFGAKVIGYLIVGVRYQYWNLDESFMIEDDKAYLKLGVFILYFVLTMSAYAIAQKYVYIWELYDCQIYVFGKMVKQQEKSLKDSKKTNKVIRKSFDVVARVDKDLKERYEDYPCTDDQISFLRAGIEKTEEELRQIQKKLRDCRVKIIRWKVGHIVYLMIGFFVASLASFVLRATTGVNSSDRGVFGVILSTMMLSAIMMSGVLVGCWLGVKLRFKLILSSYIKNKELVMESEIVEQILQLLESKADDMQHRGIKQFLSDKSLKRIASVILYFVVVTMTFLPISAKYNLDHLDTFYIVEEEEQNYVFATYKGSEYILVQCDIVGEAIIIDTNEIYITEEPIKMVRRSFKSVEKQ